MIHATASGSDWDRGVWDANAKAMTVVFSSADAKEGPTAFAEKRARSGRVADSSI
ncbi:hypothetical protein GON09_005010 [Rhodococcus sp. B50]|nr:hypothetical protein [Rhodococcus sp. B50]